MSTPSTQAKPSVVPSVAAEKKMSQSRDIEHQAAQKAILLTTQKSAQQAALYKAYQDAHKFPPEIIAKLPSTTSSTVNLMIPKVGGECCTYCNVYISLTYVSFSHDKDTTKKNCCIGCFCLFRDIHRKYEIAVIGPQIITANTFIHKMNEQKKKEKTTVSHTVVYVSAANEAVSKGHTKLIHEFLCMNDSLLTNEILLSAVQKDNHGIAKMAVQYGASYQYVDNNGNTILMTAASKIKENSDTRMMRILMDTKCVHPCKRPLEEIDILDMPVSKEAKKSYEEIDLTV